jgi:transposase-like protein
VKPDSQEPEPLALPTACPYCRSTSIAAASGKVDASTYWRCQGCGEMWNPGRFRTTQNRYGYDPRWK